MECLDPEQRLNGNAMEPQKIVNYIMECLEPKRRLSGNAMENILNNFLRIFCSPSGV